MDADAEAYDEVGVNVVQMDADAKAYDKLSKPQIESGCKFISELNLSPGAKVLDMGCGTGQITKYGEAVGIDPDSARIKIAKEKYKEVCHLQFHVGNSLTGFPHDNEPYLYDVHVTANAFHWFPHDQKKLYMQKAQQSLKPGWKLAILCSDKVGPDRGEQHDITGLQPLSQDQLQKLFEEVGLFTNVVIKQFVYLAHFETVEIYKRWIKATSHQNLDDWDPAFIKSIMAEFVTFHDDGGVTTKIPSISISFNTRQQNIKLHGSLGIIIRSFILFAFCTPHKLNSLSFATCNFNEGPEGVQWEWDLPIFGLGKWDLCYCDWERQTQVWEWENKYAILKTVLVGHLRVK